MAGVLIVVGYAAATVVSAPSTNAGYSPPDPGGGGTDTAPAELPPPVAGQSGRIERVRGIVLVKLRGSTRFVALRNPILVPVGSVVNARRGLARLTVDNGGRTDIGSFSQGSFVFRQVRLAGTAQSPAPLLTDAALAGGSFGVCRPSASSAARTAARRRRDREIRRLFVRVKGRFRTTGRFAATTVRGTAWAIEDRCRSTWARVSQGSVDFTDFVRRATFRVGAGRTRIARR